MSNEARKVGLIVWGGLAGVILLIFAAFATSLFKAKTAGPPLPVLKQQLPDFTLTNQLGKIVSLADLHGKVWLADIVFTRCPGPCPRMTKQFAQLQSSLASEPSVRLVTLTSDPEFDTVEVLKQFADRFAANPERWSFLTGPKKDIYNLAGANGLLFSIQDTKPEERTSEDDLFIHSTVFILVDKAGRIRASYESDEPEAQEKILKDIRKLLPE
jgi:protein SCO1/2